jgi:hypothetical protein
MGWTQVIEYEYVDGEVTLPPPVRKQVWNGEKFVPMSLYKRKGVPREEILLWLEKIYGQPGTYINGRFWDYTLSGNFTIMDERVYTWYQMKWGNK